MRRPSSSASEKKVYQLFLVAHAALDDPNQAALDTQRAANAIVQRLWGKPVVIMMCASEAALPTASQLASSFGNRLYTRKEAQPFKLKPLIDEIERSGKQGESLIFVSHSQLITNFLAQIPVRPETLSPDKPIHLALSCQAGYRWINVMP